MMTWRVFACVLVAVVSLDQADAITDSRLLAEAPVRVLSFNIQTFGRSKMKKPIVKDTLLKILSQYDLIAIQEIRDSSEAEFPKLVKAMNELCAPYSKVSLFKAQCSETFDVNDEFENITCPRLLTEGEFKFVVSARLGRSVSKEQYGFIYRSPRISVKETYQYDDGKDDGTDLFEREPFAALFNVDDADVREFSMINVHTKPDDAGKETDGLTKVYDSVVQKFGNENCIILGDFNSDCNYVKGDEWEQISLWNNKKFQWVIDRCMDTTVKSTDCAYDRFVVAGKDLQESVVPKSPRVVRFDLDYGLTYEEAKTVSDHYPITMQLMGKAIRGVQTNLDTFLSFTIEESKVASVESLAALAELAPKKGRFDITLTHANGVPYEVIVEADRIKDLPGAMDDFEAAFKSVVSDKLDRAFRSFTESGAFKDTPYVYGLKEDIKKTFTLQVRCSFLTLRCNVSAYRRTS